MSVYAEGLMRKAYRQMKKALREFGIPEDVILEQNFKYG